MQPTLGGQMRGLWQIRNERVMIPAADSHIPCLRSQRCTLLVYFLRDLALILASLIVVVATGLAFLVSRRLS